MRRKTKPLSVKFMTNSSDMRVAILGMAGMSSSCISRETGLTECQIGYRLRKAGILRKDYRDGNNILAEIAIGSAEDAFYVKRIRAEMKAQGVA